MKKDKKIDSEAFAENKKNRFLKNDKKDTDKKTTSESLNENEEFEEYIKSKDDKHLKHKASKSVRKSGSRFQATEKNNDRKVISYEDVPLEDYEENNNKKLTKKHIKIIILVGVIFLACVLSVIIFANKDNLTFDNISYWFQHRLVGKKEGKGYPVDILGTGVSAGNFDISDDELVYASNTSLVSLSDKGQTQFEMQISYSKPTLNTSNTNCVVYNLGGKSFEIFTPYESVYSGKTDENILSVDVASNGTYAVVTESQGYLSKVTVYDKNNEQIFAYSFADYLIYNVALDSDATHCALTGISARNGSELSSVYVLDFLQEKPQVLYEFENNTLYDVEFLSDSKLCAIGSSCSYVLSTTKNDYTDFNYDDKTLTCYDINQSTGAFVLSLSRSGSGGNCDLIYINASGKAEETISTEFSVSSVSLYKNRIGILDGNNIHLYNKLGDLLYSGTSDSNSRQIILCNDHDFYVLGLNTINRIDIRKAD